MKDKTQLGEPDTPTRNAPLINESQARRIMKELMELGIGMTGPAGMAFRSLTQGDKVKRRGRQNYDDAAMRNNKPKPIRIKNGGAVMSGRGGKFKGVR